MTDSCGVTKMSDTLVKENLTVDELFERVLEKYSVKQGITVEEARTHKIMQEIYQCLLEEESAKR